MDYKGLNGSGLAHVMNRARSEFAKKKIVTEPVYPLSSETNYTGVEVPFYDASYVFRKVADNVYQISDFVGKKQVFYENGVVIAESFILKSEMFSFTDNGSWSVGEGNIIIIQPADVGQPILVPDAGSLVFPEAGTYFWKNNNDYYSKELYIAGTYKREVEPQDFDLLVRGEIDPETFQVARIYDNDYNAVDFGKIKEAIKMGKSVRLNLLYPLDPDFENGIIIPCDVETSTQAPELEISSNIVFSAFIDIDLGDGKQLYHFKVTLSEDNTLATEYKIMSGGSDEQDNRLNMRILMSWNTLTADFPTIDDTWDELSFQDIYQAVAQNKDIVTRIGWDENADADLYRSVYTSDIAYFGDFLGEDSKHQIIISAILNIDVQNGLGKQDYYFKFILNEDDTVTTEYQLIGGGSGGEVFWVNCEFNFDTGQAENFLQSYVSIVQAFDEGKTVKFSAKYSPDGNSYEYALGDLIHYREGERELEFAVFVYANILTQEAKLHHFRITLNDKEEAHTYIELLSGGESQEAVSPTVEVVPIEGGHRVTVADVNGTDSFDVMNGKDGKPFTFADFTAEQLESLKGKAFTYEDFTEEQLNALKGKAFTYDDFTPEQLEALKGKDGNDYVLTDADKNNIIQAVLNAINPAEGRSF